jgi:RNA polymerase sigma-70 factor (ECF subfamily)
MSGTELARRLQEAPAGSELAARREVRQLLLLAITALPCETEHLLIRRYSHGATESQLAAELGITERAVEGRLRRARRALRDSLVQLDGEEGDHVVG